MLFHTATAFYGSVREMLKRIADTFPEKLEAPVKAFLAGGAAVHLYTGSRVSEDVDVEFSRRVLVPEDMVISYADEFGVQRALIFDTNYNPTFGLMHEDYTRDAIFVECPAGDTRLEIYVLSPLDLAVSKLSRFSESDRSDVKMLAEAGLIGSADLLRRANEASAYYIGAIDAVKLNVRDAVAMVQNIERQRGFANTQNRNSSRDPGGS